MSAEPFDATTTPCPHCGGVGRWRHEREAIFALLNPNGEYVEGYGHNPVSYPTDHKDVYTCGGCGWRWGGNPTVIVPPWRKV